MERQSRQIDPIIATLPAKLGAVLFFPRGVRSHPAKRVCRSKFCSRHSVGSIDEKGVDDGIEVGGQRKSLRPRVNLLRLGESPPRDALNLSEGLLKPKKSLSAPVEVIHYPENLIDGSGYKHHQNSFIS